VQLLTKDFKIYLPSLIPLIIIVFATAPSFVLGAGNRNLLLIGLMFISPFLILKFMRFFKEDIWLYLFMLSIVIFPLIFHPESLRWSTIFYSWLFAMTFMAYKSLLYLDEFKPESYLKLMKYLIYAYAIVLLIQQFCVLTGLPIFNVSNYEPSNPWKLNSLSDEPSHSARIVPLLMYCYIVIKEILLKRKYNFKLDFKEDKWVWISFLWVTLTMQSATAFIFLFIIFSKFLSLKNTIYLLLILLISIFLIDLVGIHSFERTYKVLLATITLNPYKILEVDHSAALRIVPIIFLAKMINITTINGLFGHGIDYVASFLYKVIPGIPKGVSGGGLFQLWIEYGFISFLLFVIFSIKTVYRKGDYLTLVFWFLLVFMYGVNSQIVWLTIILLYTNKYFFKKFYYKEANE